MKKKKTIVISEVLPRLLRERNITAKQLSKATGISASTISTWCLPNSKPKRIEDVAAAAEYLNCGLSMLLFNEAESSLDLQNITGSVLLDGIFKIHLEKIELRKK